MVVFPLLLVVGVGVGVDVVVCVVGVVVDVGGGSGGASVTSWCLRYCCISMLSFAAVVAIRVVFSKQRHNIAQTLERLTAAGSRSVVCSAGFSQSIDFQLLI